MVILRRVKITVTLIWTGESVSFILSTADDHSIDYVLDREWTNCDEDNAELDRIMFLVLVLCNLLGGLLILNATVMLLTVTSVVCQVL